MQAKLIDGKRIAAEIRAELLRDISWLKERGVRPGLAVILVGEDPASRIYVGRKEKTATELNFLSRTLLLPANFNQKGLLAIIRELNEDEQIHGILVQLPLPKHIDPDAIIEAINPGKDVDGFHPRNIGAMLLGKPTFVPCTPAGIMVLFQRSGIDPGGKHVVILGRSNIVGKPLMNLLMQKKKGANATVTICHTGTKDLAWYTKQADIVIAAMGKPRSVNGEMLKPGCVVIDVGTNRVQDRTRKSGYRLVGDVDFDSACEVASYITPVPGGVGPMTIIMLMRNTVLAAKRSLEPRTFNEY